MTFAKVIQIALSITISLLIVFAIQEASWEVVVVVIITTMVFWGIEFFLEKLDEE